MDPVVDIGVEHGCEIWQLLIQTQERVWIRLKSEGVWATAWAPSLCHTFPPKSNRPSPVPFSSRHLSLLDAFDVDPLLLVELKHAVQQVHRLLAQVWKLVLLKREKCGEEHRLRGR